MMIEINLYSSRFDNLLASLTEGDEKTRIKNALIASILETEAELKSSINGNTKPEATAIFQRSFNLDELDASTLAGLLIPFNVQQQLIQTSLSQGYLKILMYINLYYLKILFV